MPAIPFYLFHQVKYTVHVDLNNSKFFICNITSHDCDFTDFKILTILISGQCRLLLSFVRHRQQKCSFWEGGICSVKRTPQIFYYNSKFVGGLHNTHTALLIMCHNMFHGVIVLYWCWQKVNSVIITIPHLTAPVVKQMLPLTRQVRGEWFGLKERL